MKIVKDPIHDFIELQAEELQVVDSWEFQRLRYIKQLGTAYFVYPGATHTRFEHSLGTMHLAGLIYRQLCRHGLEFSKEQYLRVRLAALLHDIGHLAFSHALEGLLAEKRHEEVGKEIIKSSSLREKLEQLGFHCRDIINLIEGKGELGKIISSQIDADRLDYLVRDSYYAGVNYGLVSVKRIIYTMQLLDGRIVFSKKAVTCLENLLFARYQMYYNVYLHHTTECFAILLRRITELMKELGLLAEPASIEELLEITDFWLLEKLHRALREEKHPKLQELLYRFFYRRPYKLVYEKFFAKDVLEKVKEIEQQIYSVYDKYDVLVSYPNIQIYSYNPKIKKKSILILVNGKLKDIFNVSKIINRLATTPYFIFRIYVNKEKLNQGQLEQLLRLAKKV
ncbi:MAG: HD domain-containing protein [bacterium]|nr:HD domain-containing protein [bacterium]